MKKVLFAYDSSENAKRAVCQLIELANHLSQLEVGVITVIPDSDQQIMAQVPSYAEWQSKLFTLAQEEVTAVCKRLEEAGVTCTGFVRVGSPAITIINEATQQGYDTIMLGHREHDLGSVCMKIVTLSPLAVYIAS